MGRWWESNPGPPSESRVLPPLGALVGLFATGMPQECRTSGFLRKGIHWSHFANIQSVNSKF